MGNSGENWPVLDHRAELARVQKDFAAAIPTVAAATAVPWCRDWTVRDLVLHLAEVHHWAAAMARSEDVDELPAGDGLLSRYEACATELRETLAALDPLAPARTLIPDGTVAFWSRRQLHETLIHLWDLRTAGELPVVIDREVWADTVDEVVTVMHPRQVRLGRALAAPVRIALTATDADLSWTLPASPAATEKITVSGPAESLALLLWGRTGASDPALDVTGDGDVLRAVLDDRFVP